MIPLLQLAFTVMIFAGPSIGAPTGTDPSVYWTITFSNFNLSSPTESLCGLDPKTFTFDPTTLNTCTNLGGTFTRWQDVAVGSSSTIRLNCITFFSDSSCTGIGVASDDVIGASLGGTNCKGASSSFSFAK